MRHTGERRFGFWPIAIVVALLVALATLQYRWIGEVSRLERLRLEDAIGEAMLDFADDLDREVSRLAVAFAVPGLEALPEALGRWRAESLHPELLADVLVWTPGPDELARWDETASALVPAAWPVDLRSSLPRPRTPRSRLPRKTAGTIDVFPGDPFPGGPILTLPRPPTLVLSLGAPLPGERRRAPRVLREQEAAARLLLRLDEAYLRDQLLPLLAEAHFAGAVSLPVDVTVLAPGPDGDQRVYSTNPSRRRQTGRDSLWAPILRPRFFAELLAEDAGRFARSSRSTENLARRRPLASREGEGAREGWRLVVDPAAGSLDVTVARLRWRNLAVSAAILGLLGVSLAIVLRAARRRQELAQQQLALVAGITHELHTPLAALQAAAQNLEDGVVRDAARAREYGALVRREGDRLQKLVDQTLSLAGMRSGRQALCPENVPLALAIEAAIDESAPSAPDAGAAAAATVEVEIAPDAPASAWTDEAALRRILVNLLTNARKYGGGRIWIGVRHAGHGAVALTVVDDGPGVDPLDRERLFEPFHRGQRARDLTSPGSGLGLYLAQRLAEALGGSLALADATSAGAPAELRGAAFRLTLPTGPPR